MSILGRDSNLHLCIEVPFSFWSLCDKMANSPVMSVSLRWGIINYYINHYLASILILVIILTFFLVLFPLIHLLPLVKSFSQFFFLLQIDPFSAKLLRPPFLMYPKQFSCTWPRSWLFWIIFWTVNNIIKKENQMFLKTVTVWLENKTIQEISDQIIFLY